MPDDDAQAVAAVAAIGVFVALAVMTIRFCLRVQAALQVLFPNRRTAPRRLPTRGPEPRGLAATQGGG